MEVLKAGTILINKEKKAVGLVYRDNLNDYSYPKGHLEKGETLEECAIRETAEETKRDCIIVADYPVIIEKYITSKKENCVVYFYLAIDIGHSDNDSLEVHDLVWVSFDEVENILTYDSQKKIWLKVKDYVEKLV